MCRAALDAEGQWFVHAAKAAPYRDLWQGCCGIKVLARRVNWLLAEHIRCMLPELRQDIALRVSYCAVCCVLTKAVNTKCNRKCGQIVSSRAVA